MTENKIAYTATRNVGGYVWYCRTSGRLWVTDADQGYSLQFRYTRDQRPRQRRPEDIAGWWLCGNGIEQRLSHRFTSAVQKAVPLMDANSVRRNLK